MSSDYVFLVVAYYEDPSFNPYSGEDAPIEVEVLLATLQEDTAESMASTARQDRTYLRVDVEKHKLQ